MNNYVTGAVIKRLREKKGLTQEQLAHTAFPCGALSKTQTRQIAEEQGFLNAEKPDSQDICFVPDGDYAAFIRRYTGKCYPDGPFVTTQGTIVGRHRGIIHYTVGQRKGLGISSDRPLYVQSIDAAKNTVVLGEDRELFGTELNAVNFNWIAFETPPDVLRAKAKIRYRHQEQWATVEVTGKNTVHLVFDAPQRAVTRGQAVVLYDGDTVLGGGEII